MWDGEYGVYIYGSQHYKLVNKKTVIKGLVVLLFLLTYLISFTMKNYNYSCPLCSCQSVAIYYTYHQTLLGF